MQTIIPYNEIWFPDVEQADGDGLLAIGGDLSQNRLLHAYSKGIFPWFIHRDLVYWFSPNPRMVLYLEDVKISKSMKQVINNKYWKVTFNTCFTEVMKHCGNMPRKGQEGTWITDEFLEAYHKFHEAGYAHSVEVWQDEKLIGGLYGVSMGKMFVGESMFSLVSNASKYAFIFLVKALQKQNFHFLDCQVYTPHLASLGAKPIERKVFIMQLQEALKYPTDNSFWKTI